MTRYRTTGDWEPPFRARRGHARLLGRDRARWVRSRRSDDSLPNGRLGRPADKRGVSPASHPVAAPSLRRASLRDAQ